MLGPPVLGRPAEVSINTAPMASTIDSIFSTSLYYVCSILMNFVLIICG